MTDNKPEIVEIQGKTYEVYIFIHDFIIKNGYSPTVREIGKGVGLKSTSSVSAQINKLHNLGFIKKEGDCPRTITLHGRYMCESK